MSLGGKHARGTADRKVLGLRPELMEQALATKHHYDLYGIHFDFDKAAIQSDSNALLDDITTTLKQFPEWRLEINGHTDSIGDAAYNEELSMIGPNAIKQALADRVTTPRGWKLGCGREAVGS